MFEVATIGIQTLSKPPSCCMSVYIFLGHSLYDISSLRVISGGGVFLEKVSRSYKRNRDILLGTWNVRSLYRAGSLMAAARELARYKLDLVGVQQVRWDKEGTAKAGDYSFFLWERK